MPTTELGSRAPWLESQRRARSRRFEAARRLRRLRGRRSAAAVALVSLTLGAGGAVAADGTGGASPSAPSSTQADAGTVAELQTALGITADGIFGPQTRRAVRRFQRAHGIVVDGVAGPETLAALGIAAGTASAPAQSGRIGRVLQRIARCESGGDPTAVSADGRYHGKYQFSKATWRAVGGTGNPAAAPEAEQDRRAAILYRRAGASPWPVCGRRA